jgi:ornithine carbamoyltransferase
MSVRHFLGIEDLSGDELRHVLATASLTPAPPVLAGQGVALLFEKPSARTRNSTEMAVFQLGGHPVTIRAEEVGFDTRETVEDIALTLSQYHAAIAARVFDHKVLERMAAVSPVPVVNLLSDVGHPCQALADLLTLQQQWGSLAGRTIAWVGDGNNVCHSLMLAAALSDVGFRAACPPGFEPDPMAVDLAVRSGADVTVTADVSEAVAGADAVCTDVWTSMGQEEEAARRRVAFARYTVDETVMGRAAKDAVFLHCLPAHRGEEVTAGVIDGPQSLVWPQAANRMHAMRGLLIWLVDATRPSGVSAAG